MALDDDVTTPPQGPDSGTPADRAAGSLGEDEYLGRNGGAGSGAGADDPTTEAEEDTRFAWPGSCGRDHPEHPARTGRPGWA